MPVSDTRDRCLSHPSLRRRQWPGRGAAPRTAPVLGSDAPQRLIHARHAPRAPTEPRPFPSPQRAHRPSLHAAARLFARHRPAWVAQTPSLTASTDACRPPRTGGRRTCTRTMTTRPSVRCAPQPTPSALHHRQPSPPRRTAPPRRNPPIHRSLTPPPPTHTPARRAPTPRRPPPPTASEPLRLGRHAPLVREGRDPDRGGQGVGDGDLHPQGHRLAPQGAAEEGDRQARPGRSHRRDDAAARRPARRLRDRRVRRRGVHRQALRAHREPHPGPQALRQGLQDDGGDALRADRAGLVEDALGGGGQEHQARRGAQEDRPERGDPPPPSPPSPGIAPPASLRPPRSARLAPPASPHPPRRPPAPRR